MFKVVSRIIRIHWNNVWRIEIWSRWRIKFDGSEVGEIKVDEVEVDEVEVDEVEVDEVEVDEVEVDEVEVDEVEVDEVEVGDLFTFSCEHHLICFSVSERNSFQWPFSDWNKNVSNGFSEKHV